MYYQLMSSLDVPEKFTILDILILKNGFESELLTFDDLVSIPDSRWRSDFDRRVELVYPQAYNTTEVITELLQGQPIPEKPINGPRVRFVQISEEVCHPEKPLSHGYDIVVIVKSGVSQFKERQEFRRLNKAFTNLHGESILGLRIGLVFSVGLPRSQQNNIFKRGKYQLRLNTSGGQFLNPKNLDQATAQFEEERKLYKDLIVGDYEDTYFNLTMKTFHSFVWASTFCRKNRPTILFLDEDVPVSLKYLVRVLRSQPREKRNNLLHGVLVKRGRVFRFDKGPSIPKWNVLKSEIPWPLYGDYVMGFLIISSYSNIERLALGMFFTKQFPIEDAYIGLVAGRLNIPVHHSRELLDWKLIITKQKHNLRTLNSKVFK
ncbi:hypothetical protein ACTXT7_003036 [Hymenolepis weldensis]